MKNHTVTVAIIVIIALAAFFITSSVITREAMAPTTSVPQGAVIIPVSVISLREAASTSPTITVEYPQFTSLPEDFNTEISSSTNGRLAEFRQSVIDNEAARKATDTTQPGSPASAVIPESAYSFIASWEPAAINSRYVSFVMRYDSFSGGANENQDLQTYNFDLTKRAPIFLADLFGSSPNYLATISKLVRNDLKQSLSVASDGNTPTDMINAGTEPTVENFSDFTFTDYTVTFYFPKYAVAPGSFGEQKVTLPRSAIK